MSISEKVAYLKGLSEGLQLDTESKNGKLIAGILDVLEDIAEAINELEEDTENISGYIEDLDDDLSGIEEVVYSEKPMMPMSSPEHHHPECQHKYKHHHKPHIKHKDDTDVDIYDEDDDDDDDDDDMVEIKCPICGDAIIVEIDTLLENDSITCPNCNKELAVLDESETGCGCGNCSCSDNDEDDDEDDDIDALDAEINEFIKSDSENGDE